MGLGNRKIIRWMITTLWIAIGAGTLVLLVAAARRKEGKKCVGVYINIHGVSNNFFVDKKDIMDSIETIVGGDPTGQTINSFDLEKIENGLTANIWVKSAQLFFDNNEKLQVNVLEREPIARIFTTVGTTFYIDSSIEMLPLSEKFSARLPVFTDFPQEKADTALLTDIKNISLAVQKDSFCMAMIDQIDITPQKTFEMVPKIGNQAIVFGDGTNIEEKLNNLQLFYKKVIIKTGWNYYSSIDLQYKDQVVAKRKSAEDITADSLKTVQLMQQIAANAEKQSSDSAQLQPEVRDSTGSSDINMQSPAETDDADSTDDNAKPAHIDNDKKKDTTVAKPVTSVKAVKPAVATGDKKPGDAKPVIKPKSAPKKPANDY